MVEHETPAPCLEGDNSSFCQQPIIYLNNAGQARLSATAKSTGWAALTSDILPHADEDERRVRQLFAKLIEASDSDIAIHPSTAFAITMAAENVYRQLLLREEGARSTEQGPPQLYSIVVLEDQMCSAVYPWQEICQRSQGKIQLDIVPFPKLASSPGSGWTESILQRLGTATRPKVLACCLPPLHWSDGSAIDLVVVGRTCRDQGIVLVVDATQATGIMPCSIQDIQPSVLACSVHKWLRSCSGASLVYVDPALHETWQPLDQHGRGRDLGGDTYDAARDQMGKNGYPTKFYPDARKFDAGGKPNPLLLPILRASLEEVCQIDVEHSQRHLKSLLAPLLEWSERHGYSHSNDLRSHHLVGLRPSNISTEEMISIAAKLEHQGIYIAVRCGAFRVSPYLDTTSREIDLLIEALDKATQPHQDKSIF